MVIPQNRRAFLSWAARGAASVASVATAAVAPVLVAPPPPPRHSVRAGTWFQLGAERFRLQANPSRLVLIPRWEWPELAGTPQPRPIKVEIICVDPDAEVYKSVLIRR
jgi:hypothetical protein